MAEPLTDVQPIAHLFGHPPLGLFSDIDGTLAPIVPRPEDARVTPRCRELLAALIERGARVALVTGRTIEVAREMTGVDGVAYGANHGLEMWIEGQLERPAGVEPYVEAAKVVLNEMRGLSGQGVTVEDKGPVLALHYRNALNETAARAAIMDAIGRSAAAGQFDVHEGRKVVELRPRLEINKGTALTELATRLAVRSYVCLGDDRTDVDMFQAAARLHEQGIRGAIVAVNSREAAPEVMDAADYRIEGVEGVEWLLGELLNAIR